MPELNTVDAPRKAPARTPMVDTSIRPFRVNIPDEDLADLRQRIKATRWPEKETVTDFLAGRAALDDTEARWLLGDGIRLARGRGEAQ